jgi:predicted  nucleic acid-binding Zn-ribbon protein
MSETFMTKDEVHTFLEQKMISQNDMRYVPYLRACAAVNEAYYASEAYEQRIKELEERIKTLAHERNVKDKEVKALRNELRETENKCAVEIARLREGWMRAGGSDA